jgi:hypothetical protein
MNTGQKMVKTKQTKAKQNVAKTKALIEKDRGPSL